MFLSSGTIPTKVTRLAEIKTTATLQTTSYLLLCCVLFEVFEGLAKPIAIASYTCTILKIESSTRMVS